MGAAKVKNGLTGEGRSLARGTESIAMAPNAAATKTNVAPARRLLDRPSEGESSPLVTWFPPCHPDQTAFNAPIGRMGPKT